MDSERFDLVSKRAFNVDNRLTEAKSERDRIDHQIELLTEQRQRLTCDIRSLEARSKDLHAELDELREAMVEVSRG